MIRNLALTALLLLILSACSSSRSALIENQTRPYPKQLAKSGSVSIQVLRRSTKIELTNTTAESFGPTTIWLNGRYSSEIDGLEVGQSLTLDLRSFYDEWGDQFRAGGFFATRNPTPLTLVEFEMPEGLVGLIMVGDTLE